MKEFMRHFKQKFKWIRNATLCLWAGMAGNAWAIDQTFYAGVLSSASPYTQIVNHLLPNEAVGTAFVDYFNFEIADGGSASSVAVNLNLQPFLNINNLQLGLYTGQNATGSLLDGPVASGVTLTASLLTNTAYSLKVSGITSGNLGGSYSTAIAVVPEAEAWTMMLLGVGIMGVVLRRRKDLATTTAVSHEADGSKPHQH